MYAYELFLQSWVWTRENLSTMFANNKGTDQTAHVPSLLSASVIRFLENIITKLATSEISVFELASVADQADLSTTLLETPKTCFFASKLNDYYSKNTICAQTYNDAPVCLF